MRGYMNVSELMLRGLVICVVFYDNYKYGNKTLCLEHLVRLLKYSYIHLAQVCLNSRHAYPYKNY